VQTKKRVTLSKRFKCPFCANDEVVECKMDFRAGIGSLACRLCAASYQMPIHHLHEPIDVFSEWLDDCEAAAQGRQPTVEPQAMPRYESEEDEEDLPEASGLAASKKKKTTSAAAASKKNDSSGEARPSYTDLGLDDSDDSDDD
jgi:transcription elongation factor Elf1